MAQVFREETCQLNRRVRVLCVATRCRPSDWSVQVVVDRFRASPAGWSGDEDSWTPLESTINYLNNINCIYIISFGYHNTLLKKMRIRIITLKLKNFISTKRN